jgi:hypothetical protein
MFLRPNGVLGECELVVTCDRQVGNQMDGRIVPTETLRLHMSTESPLAQMR